MVIGGRLEITLYFTLSNTMCVFLFIYVNKLINTLMVQMQILLAFTFTILLKLKNFSSFQLQQEEQCSRPHTMLYLDHLTNSNH